MFIFFIWVVFTILVGISEMEDQDYIIFSLTMLYISYIINQIKPIKLSVKTYAGLLILPSLICIYIVYTCNWLLWIYPYDETLLIFSFFAYSYILLYLICEF